MRLLILPLIFPQLLLAITATASPQWAVDVPPDDLTTTGYWHNEYNERCGIDMAEAHGANAALTLEFYGSGIVARLLACDACSDVEIQIDKLPPIVLDLSDRGFQCPNSSPTFVKSDLEEGKHIITVRRLDETKTLKLFKFEYLTSKPVDKDQVKGKPSSSEGTQIPFSAGDASNIAGAAAGQVAKSAVKSAAKYAVKQAVQIAASYAIMAGLRFAANAVIEHVAGPGASDILPDGNTFIGDGGDGVVDVGGEWFDAAGVDGGAAADGNIWFDPVAVADEGALNADVVPDGLDGDVADFLLDALGALAGFF